ncbi:MAG: hypothetical protein R6T87_12260, partial [Marinobacter sp.]
MYVTRLRPQSLSDDEALIESAQPFTSDELHAVLNTVELQKPGRELAAWRDVDDARLRPLVAGGGDFPTSLGVSFRRGPHTVLIFAEAGDPIRIWQEGRSRTNY